MNNFAVLFSGELERMQKYHILTASVVVSFFWIGMIHLLEVPDITYLFTMVVFFDIVSMAIVLIGVTIFFEKQEGVLKSLFVSPISKTEFLISKISANLVSNLITIVIVYLYALVFKEIYVNIFGLLGAVLIIGVFHSLLGLLIVYRSQDFTELLIGMMKYFLVFMIPVVLEQFEVITSELYSNLLFIIPTKSSAVLVEAAAGYAEMWEILLSLIYLIIVSIVLGYIVFKKFNDFTIRESGV
ncbi:MAG: ABC transporter permease [bacterium]